MFKKFFTFVLAFSLFSVTAQASTQNGLKAALDELNYSLSIEWDQKDKAFHDAKVATFATKVQKFQEQGLSNADVLAIVKAETKNEKFAKEMETALNMIALNKMSPSEASEYMRNAMSKTYSQGASWGGASSLLLGVGILLVVVAAVLGGGVAGGGGSSSSCGYDCWDSYYGEYYYCCY